MRKLIKLSDVKPGMEIAENITNRFGQVMLYSGTVLTEKHITLFQTWGIEVLSVYQSKTENPEELSAEKEKYMKELLSELTWTPKILFEQDLINMCVEDRLYRQKNETGGNNES